MSIDVGTVLWRMAGRKDNKGTIWNPECRAVSKINDRKFLFSDGSGASMNSIGRSYFLSREDCLKDWEDKEFVGPDREVSIIELPQTDFEDVIIYYGYDTMYETGIYAGGMGELTKIDFKEFAWRGPDEESISMGIRDKWLTLKEIAEQYYKSPYALRPSNILTVIQEGPTSGEIYQIGNYRDMRWVKYGTTRGYA